MVCIGARCEPLGFPGRIAISWGHFHAEPLNGQGPEISRGPENVLCDGHVTDQPIGLLINLHGVN
jgi:hypothetical protein